MNLTFFTLSLCAMPLLAACGDDDPSGTGGGNTGGGTASSSASAGGASGTSQTTSTATASTGGQGGGTGQGGDGGSGQGGDGGSGQGGDGQGGDQPIACDDDDAICAHRVALAESCGQPTGDGAQAACEEYALCERRLWRDDLECAIFTCRAEADTCDATCGHVLDGFEPSAAGQVFLDACPDVMQPCEEEDTELYCSSFARSLADDILEGFTACLDPEATCGEIEDCLDLVIISNPECPDL